MKIKKNILIVSISAAAIAIAGIAVLQTQKNAANRLSAPDPKLMQAAQTELQNIAGKSGLAFGQIQEAQFFWYKTDNPKKPPLSISINGSNEIVGAVAPEEVAALKNIFTESGFSPDADNSAAGYNAARAGFRKNNIVCAMETAKNLINFSYSMFSAVNQQGNFWDIRISCGGLPENAKFAAGENEEPVLDFETCRAAGYPIINAGPRQCLVQNNVYFDNETCETKNGEKMAISEAAQIEEQSDCAREASPKNRHICDPERGVWEIDLEMHKPGCDPTCVIDIAKKTAKIDYRCPAAQ